MILRDLLSCLNYRQNMEKCEDKAASVSEVVFDADLNSRGIPVISVDGKHLSIKDLKAHIQKDPTLWFKICKLYRGNNCESTKFPKKPKILDYLHKIIPKYPTPVEFHVSCVVHVTEEGPFEHILYTEEFRPPNTKCSWWSLNINDEERTSAEERYLQEKFTNRSHEQKPFLHHFTNSPAFLKESCYGSYRFKLPLVDLMGLYREQFCGGEEPVLRVMETMFYKQEIVYAVLVHSPQNNQEFTGLPLLENSQLVRYQDGKMVWRAQAISNCLEYELLVTYEGNAEVQHLSSPEYYVWDHVALAFHLPEKEKGLRVPRERLVEALEACRISERNLVSAMWDWDDERAACFRAACFEAAEKRVAELKEELKHKMETEIVSQNKPENND